MKVGMEWICLACTAAHLEHLLVGLRCLRGMRQRLPREAAPPRTDEHGGVVELAAVDKVRVVELVVERLRHLEAVLSCRPLHEAVDRTVLLAVRCASKASIPTSQPRSSAGGAASAPQRPFPPHFRCIRSRLVSSNAGSSG